jgi:formylglycine-generating enzyme required for sulfatase activity
MPPPEVNPGAVVWRTELPPRNPQSGDVWMCPADGKAMVLVGPGPFRRGSREGQGQGDECPLTSVRLDGFWIDRTEVTNGEYRAFVDETGHAKSPHWAVAAFAGPDQPVVCVTWEDALAYATWAGKRLPTEAEWEKAARGTDGRLYPWGNQWDTDGAQRCNFADCNTKYPWSDPLSDDGYRRTAPVGSYPEGASPYGCLDMLGNAAEWCWDWYGADYYSQSPTWNPQGPATGEYRIWRGGSWYTPASFLSTTFRDLSLPSPGSHSVVGFRCVREAE